MQLLRPTAATPDTSTTNEPWLPSIYRAAVLLHRHLRDYQTLQQRGYGSKTQGNIIELSPPPHEREGSRSVYITGASHAHVELDGRRSRVSGTKGAGTVRFLIGARIIIAVPRIHRPRHRARFVIIQNVEGHGLRKVQERGHRHVPGKFSLGHEAMRVCPGAGRKQNLYRNSSESQ